MLGIIAGPIISGYVFDTTGSYTIAFLGFSGAALVSMILVFMAKAPVKTRPTARARG
jgi:cyanate permease